MATIDDSFTAFGRSLIGFRGGSRRGDRVRRRDFVTLVGGTAAWPLIARA
jgi:hypothetical protein